MKKLIFFLLINLAVSFPIFAKQTTPELILCNGKIFTSDPAQPNAEAVVIGGEYILAVGSNEEIKKLANAKTSLIDLQNRFVTPGFNDAHNHFMPKPPGFNLRLTDLEPDWAETVEAIKNAVKETPRGQGKLADLAVLSQDIFSIAPDELPKTQSILTIHWRKNRL